MDWEKTWLSRVFVARLTTKHLDTNSQLFALCTGTHIYINMHIQTVYISAHHTAVYASIKKVCNVYIFFILPICIHMNVLVVF